MVPTYNERECVEALYRQLRALHLDLDMLFIDDSSPDGTGEILDRIASEDPRVRVTYRGGKEGVGSAHLVGIRHAYAHGYQTLITMDADLTHSPSLVPLFIANRHHASLIVGSRFLSSESLADWSPHRRFLTELGHVLTRRLLGVRYDATGALRLYRLDRIPADVFDTIEARGYDFFFESMFMLCRRGVTVHEIPISLPKRTYGHSKMSTRDVLGSVAKLLRLWLRRRKGRPAAALAGTGRAHGPHADATGWDEYWRNSTSDRSPFAVIARIYRRFLISPAVRHYFRRYFRDESGRRYLHAGCGSAESDRRIGFTRASLVLMDSSREALLIARRNSTAPNTHVVCGDLFRPPFRDDVFDGAWNLGVMEHFEAPEIQRIFIALARVLKAEARTLVFWPPRYGLSVITLAAFLKVANAIRRSPLHLYPDEVSLFSSTQWARGLMHGARLVIDRTHFGIRDLFTYVVVIARKGA